MAKWIPQSGRHCRTPASVALVSMPLQRSFTFRTLQAKPEKPSAACLPTYPPNCASVEV